MLGRFTLRCLISSLVNLTVIHKNSPNIIYDKYKSWMASCLFLDLLLVADWFYGMTSLVGLFNVKVSLTVIVSIYVR